jgi:hypothetical protein
VANFLAQDEPGVFADSRYVLIELEQAFVIATQHTLLT